jgi:ubiquitin-protein ligase
MIPFQRKRIEKELGRYGYKTVNGNQLFFTYKCMPIRVELTDSYPFFPPKVYVKDKLIQYRRSDYPFQEWQTYEKQYNNIHNSTILYKKNWTPVLGIESILNEYFFFQKNMEKVRMQLFLEKHTTLPNDMIHEIVEYI